MDDYFAAQSLIIDRLKEQIPGLRDARAMAEVEDAREVGRATPMAYVIYVGEVVKDDPESVALTEEVIQHWLVLLVTRSTREMREGSGVRELAGPLLAQINAALLGWQPGASFAPLRKVTAPAPAYEDGYGYFPQVFTTCIPVWGNLTG